MDENMQTNVYLKCNICGAICDLKYQMGFSKKHPIRYRCTCGVCIRGEYTENVGITFENATEIKQKNLPDFVVHSSGELLTLPPYSVTCVNDIMRPTSFILSTLMMDYDKFRSEFSHIINYRDNQYPIVNAINELYKANNLRMLKKTIREKYDPDEVLFPLNNDADILRAVSMINQFQFLDYDGKGTTQKVTDIYFDTCKNYADQVNDFAIFLDGLNKTKEWKGRINRICSQVYSKIDLLIPAVGLDYYKEGKEEMLSGAFSITTTSFEDIKQIYVDLFELICDLLIVAIGFDNIIVRNDYNSINTIKGLKVSTLADVPNMRKKANILKLVDFNAPLEQLLYPCLNPGIRNSIGHFSYDSEEVADGKGQLIRFYEVADRANYTDVSLVQICYDIWQMYKCLGIFNELIYRLEIQKYILNGIVPSFCTSRSVRNKMMPLKGNKKIYPNEKCPCGSGKKYKKCCGK
jgi:hypothetical protein